VTFLALDMKKYDVAVVGGGPIGSYAAKNIADAGFKVALFEEHKEIGIPLKCAGLVTPRVFDITGLSSRNVVQNEIYGAHIHSPSGEVLTIGGDRVHALVINRSLFDLKIAENARDSGAEVYLQSKVTSAERKDNHIQLNIEDAMPLIICSLLIGADGSHSKIRESFGFPQPTTFLVGIGAEVTNTELDPRFVEIFLGKNIAPGFFAWIIPTDKEGSTARIGLCTHTVKRLKQCFKNLLKIKQLRDVKITRHIGGDIPLGPLKESVKSNVMLIGDAAGQVKPTSGGGIYPGLLCASICSSVAIEALDKNDVSYQSLKKYQTQWISEIGKELSAGIRFRRIFKNLDDKQIDKYIHRLNTKENIDIICKYGDIDYPSKLALPLLRKNPSFLKLLPSALINKQILESS
jgi:geranylgeranyl reductase family protein